MAENKDLKFEYDIFADIWKFFKKYYDMDNTEKNWNEVMGHVHSIGKKYNSQLCNDLLVSVVTELERRIANNIVDM